jgi:hypothetical protein
VTIRPQLNTAIFTSQFVLLAVYSLKIHRLNNFKSTVWKGKVKKKVKFRIGALQHRSLKAYCALTLKEFLHSSLEALHTERFTAPQLAKEGTM